ncbi:glycosyltransferase [Corynebacterium choanae]
MFSQTQSSRSYLEAIAPFAAGKTVLMPPMIPEMAFVEQNKQRQIGQPLSIVYSGKLARDWKTLEMLTLPKELSAHGISATLTVVGEKFNRCASDPSWVPRMQQALREAAADPDSGVTWLGALSREESIAVIQQADIGLGWRTEELDSSLEISTKALEYGAAGTAPVINVTADHIDLYGSDYPGFVTSTASTGDMAATIADLLPQLNKATHRALAVAQQFSMTAAEERLKQATALLRAGQQAKHRPGSPFNASPATKSKTTATTRICIASHDFKFMGELSAALSAHPNVKLSHDPWKSLHVNTPELSSKAAKEADIILCEFGGPAVVWHAKKKRNGAKLFVRMHGFEFGANWLEELDWEKIDGVVVVSEHYRQLFLNRYPIRPEQTHVIANMIDAADMDRPKTPQARFTVGIVGIVPYLKRPDLAVETLRALRSLDDRFRLRIKSRMPWEYEYIWTDPLQRIRYLEFFDRIRKDTDLRNRISFDQFSPDIANWLRGVGYVLSPSDTESFHLAPAEGAASGALPIVWRRLGSSDIFGEQYIVDSTEEAASRINSLAQASHDSRERVAQECKTTASRWSIENTTSTWFELFGV